MLKRRIGERGAALIFVLIGFITILSVAMFSADLGAVLTAKRHLQMAADNAATAAGLDLPDWSTAADTALRYSASDGQLNASNLLPGVRTTTVFHCNTFDGTQDCAGQSRCVASSGGTIPRCTGDDSPNFVIVRQEVTVPLHFARLVGITSTSLEATAIAARVGGAGVRPLALDIALVIDATGSMDRTCSAEVEDIDNPMRIDCAKAGVRALLSSLWPCDPEAPDCSEPWDRVGLYAFPGVREEAVSKHLDCQMNLLPEDLVEYGGEACACQCVRDRYRWEWDCESPCTATLPTYEIVPLSNDFKQTNDDEGFDFSGSDLVRAVDFGDGASGCASEAFVDDNDGGSSGNDWEPGYGLEPEYFYSCSRYFHIKTYSTSYVEAISAAQTALAADRNDVQKVLIVLGDGDLNLSAGSTDACAAAVSAAHADADTWVYSIAYEAPTSVGWSSRFDDVCSSAYSTPLVFMQALANDPERFFNQPQSGDLTEIFLSIADDLVAKRTRIVRELPPPSE